MTYRLVSFTAVIGLAVAIGVSTDRAALPRVNIVTTLGTIVVEIDTVRAPITGANFLRYVDESAYDSGSFSRVVRPDTHPNDSIRIEVIQASARQNATHHPAIDLERTSKTGLRHRDGTISMARAGPNTATSSFFLCINDQPALDFGGKRNPDGQGFGAFGQVVSGMEVVKAIQMLPAKGQSLEQPVIIESVKRVK